MKNTRRPLSKQAALKTILLLVGILILLIAPLPLPAKVGAIDFRPYWSSSLLLAHGQDFGDPSLLDSIERTLTGWNEPFTMYAWFAPTGNLVLLPYTLLPFPQAVHYWLLTNIAIVFVSALLIWRHTSRLWLPLLTAFSFSMTLVSLVYGQVNTLVLLGLALFLFLTDSGRDYAAGAGLVLTTIKPHLVILTLPLLLLETIRRRQWRVLAGFASALAVCALILFALYPAWHLSFWRLMTFGMSLARETPTIPGLFVVAGEYVWGKWLWVIGLFLATALWWNHGGECDQRMLTDISILAGMSVSPLGWSYDQVMLLFPIFSILDWAVSGSLVRRDAILAVIVLLITNAITFYQRIVTSNDVWFFWVPLVVAAVYVFARLRRQTGRLAAITHAV